MGMMMGRGGQYNRNSLETKYKPRGRIILGLSVPVLLGQGFILLAVWLLEATALFWSWVFFALFISDVFLGILSGYILRAYIREDSFDWASVMSNFVVNANNVQPMLNLVQRLFTQMRYEQRADERAERAEQVPEDWDNIVQVDMGQVDDTSDDPFD